jgi:hypothetical protein
LPMAGTTKGSGTLGLVGPVRWRLNCLVADVLAFA